MQQHESHHPKLRKRGWTYSLIPVLQILKRQSYLRVKGSAKNKNGDYLKEMNSHSNSKEEAKLMIVVLVPTLGH